MTLSQIIIESHNLNEFMVYVKDNMSFDYENKNSNMYILASEDFYFTNSSVQLNLIIAKLEDSHIIVDLMENNVGRLLERITGLEKKFITKSMKIIKKYVEINNLKYEVKIDC